MANQGVAKKEICLESDDWHSLDDDLSIDTGASTVPSSNARRVSFTMEKVPPDMRREVSPDISLEFEALFRLLPANQNAHQALLDQIDCLAFLQMHVKRLDKNKTYRPRVLHATLQECYFFLEDPPTQTLEEIQEGFGHLVDAIDHHRNEFLIELNLLLKYLESRRDNQEQRDGAPPPPPLQDIHGKDEQSHDSSHTEEFQATGVAGNFDDVVGLGNGVSTMNLRARGQPEEQKSVASAR